MALQFILGNSGSGKTEYMYRQVVKEAEGNPQKNYLVVVPEQFTMQTQRKLVDLSAYKAIMNIDVLSFERLAYRIFDELGIENLSVLEETGKNLVLRKVAQQCEDKLGILKGNMHRMGYINEIKSLVSELMQYNISPEQLKQCVTQENLSAGLKSKLADISVIYEGFEEYLKGHYITSEELLHVLSAMAGESEILRGSVMVLDEFTGFTPVQVELLHTLLSICEEIRVSLTMDVREDFYHSKGMEELFYMPKKTIEVLAKHATKAGCTILPPVLLSDGDKKRFGKAPALYFMEQNLFRSDSRKWKGTTGEIRLYSMRNPKEELIWTARKIKELVQEEGYRYREIAVVSGNMDSYSSYVEGICGKYEIPFFLDATKEVLFHPFIEFIRSVLEVIRTDFTYNSVMRLLRTGYTGLTEEETDKLENYLLATGIRGSKAWNKRWLRLPKNEKAYQLEEAESARSRFMEKFAPLTKVFYKDGTVEEMVQALYDYMTELQVERQLKEREAELLAEGEQAKAKEYGQIYGVVMDLFDKCADVLGMEVMSVSSFEEILDSGFEAAKVAVIPPGYDSVTFGDIERTRLNHIKVLIFLGVNEGVIPKATDQGGIISGYERESLEATSLTLAPGAREQAFIQKFYLYLNMTKPSEQLILSYSRVDGEGKSVRPSYLIRTILRMFPEISVEEKEEAKEVPEFSTERAAREYFLGGKRDETWYALANLLLHSEDERNRNQCSRLLDAFYDHYHHDPISSLVAEALYGKNIQGSVSRLEKFARCAYAHFLSYGLRLREREESGFENVDVGNLYHSALENYSKKLKESNFDWFTIPENVREEYAGSSMEEAVLAYPNLSIYGTAENIHLTERLNFIFRQTVWALTTQVRKGRFVPKDFEVAFSKADHLDALEFSLENQNKIQLAGRIDRMDTCADNDKIYVKIIDYKSGAAKFDLVKLYQGTQLQLVVYMNAAMELEKKAGRNREVIPGGMFYYHIDDPVIEVSGEESEEALRQQILEQLRPSGLVNREEEIYRSMDSSFEGKSDVIPLTLKKDGTPSANSSVVSTEEFQVISEYVNHRIEEMGNSIYNGNVEVAPVIEGQQSSCTYCPYKAVCGFDTKVEGFRGKIMPTADKKDVLALMETENAISKSRKKE